MKNATCQLRGRGSKYFGSMIVDNNSIGIVVEKTKTVRIFYSTAHKHIYDAIVDLYSQKH